MPKFVQYQRLDLAKIPKDFRGRSAFIVQLWWIVQSTLFAWSPQFLYGWRVFLLHIFGAKVGKGVLVRPSVQITYPWKVTLGDYSRLGDRTVLYSLGEITIGSNSVISQGSYLCAGGHDYSSITFDIYEKPIIIEDQVWLAADVFVAPGIRVGYGSVVGARSTVLKDLPSGMICYGNPAKPIRPRIIRNEGIIIDG